MEMKKYTVNYDPKKIQNIYQLLNDGKLAIALREIRNYMENYPTDDLGLLTYADCLLKMIDKKVGATSNYQEIEETCLQVINKESKFKGSAYELLGRLRVKQKNRTEAEAFYKKALALGNSRVKNSLIAVLLTNQKNQEALAMIDSIDDYDYDHDLLLLKASALYHLDRYGEGLNVVNQIDPATLSKGVSIYYYTRIKAKLFMALDRNEEAQQLLEAYVKQSSIYNKNYCLLVDCYLKQKRVKEAYILGMDVMENAEDSIKLYASSSIGDIYRELVDFRKAKQAYLKAINPNNNEGKRYNAYVSLGELSLVEEDYEQARKYFQKLDSANRRSKIKKTTLLALVELKQNHVSKAYKMLSKIDDRNIPSDLQNLYHQTKKIAMKGMEKEIVKEDYFSKQLANYSKHATIKHVEKYHRKANEIAFFDQSIPLYSAINLVPKLLESGIRVENRAVEKYLVPYQNVGYCNGKLTDYMEVVMLPETTHVLTMYPVNHLSEEELQKEVKQAFQKKKMPSRIAKFNARYGQKG